MARAACRRPICPSCKRLMDRDDIGIYRDGGSVLCSLPDEVLEALRWVEDESTKKTP